MSDIFIPHICWYCIWAFRENKSEVSCKTHNCKCARSFACKQFLEDPKKKYADQEQIHI